MDEIVGCYTVESSVRATDNTRQWPIVASSTNASKRSTPIVTVTRCRRWHTTKPCRRSPNNGRIT